MPTVQERLHAVVDNIAKVIVGKREACELVLVALLCEGHVLVEDIPGVGKTSLVSALARSVDSSFRRIQFTPDILPSDITGFSLYSQKTGEFEYKPGLVLCNFVLADEINRTSPKTQASLLEVMEEGQVTVDGVSRRVGEPFMVMATQNPTEYVGTYPLPEAQMDRFFMRVRLGYPERKDEIDIIRRFRNDDPLRVLEPVTVAAEIVRFQKHVREVFVSDSLYRYTVDIVRKTRSLKDVTLGASPRGSISLFRAAQAWAMYEGRDYVLPDDVKAMAVPVLAHRLILTQDARIRQVSADALIQDILQQVTVPPLQAHD